MKTKTTKHAARAERDTTKVTCACGKSFSPSDWQLHRWNATGAMPVCIVCTMKANA
jgi:hypothetical protein